MPANKVMSIVVSVLKVCIVVPVLNSSDAQHVFQLLDSLGHVVGESLVVNEEVGPAIGQLVVKLLGHAVHIAGYGVLDVILLPVHV